MWLHLMYQQLRFESPRKKRERQSSRKTIWRNKGPKLPESEEKHEYTHSRGSMNFQESKEIYIKTHYTQIIKIRRQWEDFRSSKRERTRHIQKNLQ